MERSLYKDAQTLKRLRLKPYFCKKKDVKQKL